MKTKLDIFSSTKLKDFFQNLEGLFDISLKNFDDLDECYNASNISIVFFNDQGFIEDTILNNVLQKENFIFIFRELSMFDKSSIDLKKNIDLFLNETKTEYNISFFYHRSSELIDIMIEYYDLLNRYDELFNAILLKTQESESRNAESLAV